MPRLNAQAAIRSALESALPDVPVRVTVPDPRPSTLVVVRREGGARQDALLDRAGIGIDMWAPTEAEAAELAERVGDAMWGLSFADGFALVIEESMRSERDMLTDSPRWYASYTVTTYKPATE